jgi:WD40 repeat protein/ribosomal protein S27E
MADAFLTARCPGCGATSSRVPATLAGRTVRCPTCGTRFAVPEPAPAATVPEDRAVAPTVPEAEVAGARPLAPAGISWRPGEVVLGLYEVMGVLGEGGMGRVYRVRHRGWAMDLAVKVPLPATLEAAGGADLFEREAETWVNLGLHPHVVTCHYVRRMEGLPLVFAELVDGGTLHDAIRARRLASVEAILDVAIQFAWGLHHAHEQGLVHRDVKPANVMLTSDGIAKVTDFGLARARAARAPGPLVQTGEGGGHTMTVEGGGGGTPAYLSPEQARGDALTRRSDLWSFALSLLEAFLGERTWSLGIVAADVLRACHEVPGRPRLPPAVADFLAQCFRERPEERPRGLDEAAAVLIRAWADAMGRPYPRQQPRGARGAADGLNNRAVSLVDLGRAAEATALWRRALEAQPQHLEATYNALLASWGEGRVDDEEARRRLLEACASHASSPRAQQLLGRFHLTLGKPAEARACFERMRGLGASEDLEVDLAAARAPAPGPLLTLRGLSGPVSALALAPDGGTVAAASGREVRVWDAGSGGVRRVLQIPEGAVHALALFSEGRLLVGAEGAPLTVWDLSSGRVVRPWARHPGFCTCVAVAPGGLVVSGGSDRVVRLWDAASGRCVREMEGHEDAVTGVAVGASGLASASRDGTVRLWALEDGRCRAVLRGDQGHVEAVVMDEAASRVISAGDDRIVRDWGLNSHELVRAYASHTRSVHALAFSAKGGLLLSGSADGTARGWDCGAERIASLVRLDGAVHALVCAADGRVWAAHGSAVSGLTPPPLRIAAAALCRPSSAVEVEERATSFEERIQEARRSLSAGDFAGALSLARTARSIPGHERAEAALSVWDDLCSRLPRQGLQSAWEETRLEGHSEQVLAVAVDGGGRLALSGSLDSTARLWDLATNRAAGVLSGHEGPVTAAAFAGEAGRAVTGGRDHTLRVWDIAGRRLLRTLEGHGETVAGVDVSPEGSVAASASWDGTVRLWDLARGTVMSVLEGHEANVAAVRFSADGQALASAGWDGAVRLWHAESGEALCALPGHEGNATAVAFHPTGRQLASGGEDGTLRLWDPKARRCLKVLAGHQGEITAVAFSPDGRFLFSSSRDRSVRIWDAGRGVAVRTLPHPAAVLDLALLPLGSRLLAAGADRLACLWHLDWEPEPAGAAASDERVRPFLETLVSRRNRR